MKSIYKEETPSSVPSCCLTCGNYKPQFFNRRHLECAAFGTVKGVKWERCGAWTSRPVPPNK